MIVTEVIRRLNFKNKKRPVRIGHVASSHRPKSVGGDESKRIVKVKRDSASWRTRCRCRSGLDPKQKQHGVRFDDKRDGLFLGDRLATLGIHPVDKGLDVVESGLGIVLIMPVLLMSS